mgnify:FL=1
MHISGNIIDGSVVALSTGYNGLGNSDDIPVVQGDVFSLDCVQNRVDHDLGNIIPLTDNGCANAAGNGTNGPLHSGKLLFISNRFFYKRMKWLFSPMFIIPNGIA